MTAIGDKFSMTAKILLSALCALMPIASVRAVQSNGSYTTTPPTVSNWNNGWPANDITGWDYVGWINGASGVYLGNGWVVTAGHVGFGNFVLSGQTYQADASTVKTILRNGSTADITVFHLLTQPALPTLTISTALPVAFSATVPGTQVVMLGMGGGLGLTWGTNTVTATNVGVTPEGYPFTSVDFLTDLGTVTRGSSSISNGTVVVGGDSGGGAFVYNSTTAKWELAGINEVVGTYTDTGQTFSGLVQFNKYYGQINAIVQSTPSTPADTPVMPWPGLAMLGAVLVITAVRSLRVRPA